MSECMKIQYNYEELTVSEICQKLDDYKRQIVAYEQAVQEGRILPRCKDCRIYPPLGWEYDTYCKDCICGSPITNNIKGCICNFEPAEKDEK